MIVPSIDDAGSSPPAAESKLTVLVLADRSIDGRPVYLSEYVHAGHIWGVPKDLVMVAVRQDATLVVDRSRFFEYDATSVRAVLRVAYGMPYPQAIVRIEGPGTLSS